VGGKYFLEKPVWNKERCDGGGEGTGVRLKGKLALGINDRVASERRRREGELTAQEEQRILED